MKQLESALRSAGFLPTPELKAERDRAIGALVKTRRQKRRGAKQLKARVLALVSALRIPAPVVTLLVLVAMPSLALAHSGHGGHDAMPPGQLIGAIAVTLGLAAHAWVTWGGKRQRALAAATGGGDIGGGSPEPTAELTDEQRAWERENLKPYYTVIIPFVPLPRMTVWHPTESTGPFAVLSRGAFPTERQAREWATERLNNTPYTVRRVTFDLAKGEDTFTTVYRYIDSDTFDREVNDVGVYVGGNEGGSSYRVGDDLYAMRHNGTTYEYDVLVGFYASEVK